jgi:hypothetical protein
VPGGFTIDSTVDEEQGTVTCPAGVTRPMSPARAVSLGPACARCPLRDLCTTAKDGRSMTIHPHDDLLRAARDHGLLPLRLGEQQAGTLVIFGILRAGD